MNPSTAKTQPEISTSIPDRVEAELRELILKGTIQPGKRINVRQLEQHFGVSHIPIREAIRRLEGEGLIETSPGRGATASRVSLRELDEIYDLRRIVEPQVARRSVDDMDDADVAAVAAAYDRLDAAERHAASGDFSDAHWDFHWHVLRPGATGEIQRLLHRLWRAADRYLLLTRPLAVAVAHEQHEHLLDACRRRDGDDAAIVLERHLHVTGDVLRTQFDKAGLDDGDGDGRARRGEEHTA